MAREPKSKFMRSPNWPAHLSVGCALLDGQDRIAVHHHLDSPFGELYTLMRETLHDDETLEAAVARGLMEEWGAEADTIAYLGAKLDHIEDANGPAMDKTTVYFLARLTMFDESLRDIDDPEYGSRIEWLPLEEAKRVMNSQAARLSRYTDLHEANIVELTQRFLALTPTRRLSYK